VSFPAGFDKDGLPIGVQVLGPDFSEAILLRIGRSYEKVIPGEAWREKRPGLLI
jgi:aspartyl-tRNA(Asn)/glutamyl-tRNA(Gln) amidotransferase subunit A